MSNIDKYIKDKGIEGFATAVATVIQAMKSHKGKKNFKFDMDTFGEKWDGVCFGCMATATLEDVTGISLVKKTESLEDDVYSSYERASLFKEDFANVSNFELAIDSFRCHRLQSLMLFCGLNKKAQSRVFKIGNKYIWDFDNRNRKSWYTKQLPEMELFLEDVMREFDLEWKYE